MKRVTASAVLLSMSVVSGFCSAASSANTKDQDYWRDMEASSQAPSTVVDKTNRPAAQAPVGTTRPVSTAQPLSLDQKGSRKASGAAERTDE
jgi:hypothetical protein